MKVCICQPTSNNEISEAIAKLERIVESNSADLYVFPELYLTDYLIRDDLYRLAISRNSKEIIEIVNLSRRTNSAIIVGFPEKDRANLYNSALIAVSGDAKFYRKIHLPNFGPFEEKIYFKEGNEILLFNYRDFNIAVQICYDIFFPELSKLLALSGAEIIVNISASPTSSRFFFESVISARAIETTSYFVYCNWAGVQRNFVFWGGSRIVRPNGTTLVRGKYYQEDLITGYVDYDEIIEFRRSRPLIRDSRLKINPSLI